MCVWVCVLGSVVSDSLRPHELYSARLLCPWHFSGKNTGVGCHFLVQGIFLTQGWNPCLLCFLHCRLILYCWAIQGAHRRIRSDQISRSVMSDSLQPHESQHARPPCPSPTPEFTETHIHRVSDAIQPSHPLSSPSPPAPNHSQHQSLFQWVNSSHEVAKVLEFQL